MIMRRYLVGEGTVRERRKHTFCNVISVQIKKKGKAEKAAHPLNVDHLEKRRRDMKLIEN